MPLPKLKHPLHAFVVPSTKKKVSFRPFLVKEEKLLLMARASDTPTDIFTAIMQVINNCCVEKGFDVENLALFDMEYLYLKLHSVSVSNVIKVSYIDNEDKKTYDFDVDLASVEMEWPKEDMQRVKIDEKTGIVMRYPKANIYKDDEFIKDDKDAFFNLIARCVETIYSGDEVFQASEYSVEEVKGFLEDLDVKTFEKISVFMTNQPHMHHVITYKNSLENERKIELSTLSDFFTLR